jgi:hypothetical protein
MTEEKDLWLRDAALSYGLLRLALGLNISFHGVVRWAAGLRNFPESLLPMFQKTPCPRGPSTASAACCPSSRR